MSNPHHTHHHHIHLFVQSLFPRSPGYFYVSFVDSASPVEDHVFLQACPGACRHYTRYPRLCLVSQPSTVYGYLPALHSAWLLRQWSGWPAGRSDGAYGHGRLQHDHRGLYRYLQGQRLRVCCPGLDRQLLLRPDHQQADGRQLHVQPEVLRQQRRDLRRRL